MGALCLLLMFILTQPPLGNLQEVLRQDHQVYLPYLQGDVTKCLTKSLLSAPLHHDIFMLHFVKCVKIHFSLCLIRRTLLKIKHLYSVINNPRYCGLYASDLHEPQINLNIQVVQGHGILLDILYFNLAWSGLVRYKQGVIFPVKKGLNSVYCGKRLPWQYVHLSNTLLMKVYGLPSESEYLMFFYGIQKNINRQQCCNRMKMPPSLTMNSTMRSSRNEFYIFAALEYIISVETDLSNVFVMFDGPGKKSPLHIVPSNSPIFSSSSQIVISASTPSRASGHVWLTYINQFNIELLTKHNCYHHNARSAARFKKINIKFEQNKNNYICYYMFSGFNHVVYRPYINITMFDYHGPTVHTEALSTSCQYGGVYYHTRDSAGNLKLRMEMCGNIGQIVPPIISYDELDVLMSIVFYTGYSSVHFMAEAHVISCSILPLPCSVYHHQTIRLSGSTLCNIYYFIWLGEDKQIHNCEFKFISVNSRIIGPAELKLSANINVEIEQSASADLVLLTESFNDWPNWTLINKQYLHLNFNQSHSFSQSVQYLDTLVVRYTGLIETNRLVKLIVKVASCIVRDFGDLYYSIQYTVIISSNSFENRQFIRTNKSFDFMYAPLSDKEILEISADTIGKCKKRPASSLYLLEYQRKTKTHYNYTVKSSEDIKFKTKHPGSDGNFFLRYEIGFKNISPECKLLLRASIAKRQSDPRHRREMIQRKSRTIVFHRARFVFIEHVCIILFVVLGFKLPGS